MENERYKITGMSCSACSSRVEKVVAALPGVEAVSVNLLTNSMTVDYDEGQLSTVDIVDTVDKSGYGATVVGKSCAQTMNNPVDNSKMAGPEQERLAMKKRIVVSFVFLIPLMLVSMGHMVGLPLPGFLSGVNNGVSFAFTQFLLCLPVVVVNRKYYINGFKNLARLAPNMDSLIAVGSGAALAYGVFAIYRMSYGLGVGNMELVHQYHMDLYFESAAMILTLITLGKYLEARSKGKTSEAITKMMDLSPKTAWVIRDGVEVEVPAEAVAVGERVAVRPGASFPVDGLVVSGTTAVDESTITGESIPVEKNPGDSVIAATINTSGYVEIQAQRVGADTAFSEIIRLVEEASASKAPIARMADKIAGVFVPSVMVIALASTIFWLATGSTFEFALSMGIAVLVISCPCALGLATPVAIMVGTGKGAENGILIKTGEALERACTVDTVVLDKTGTITTGKPSVTDVWSAQGDTEGLWSIAGALEKPSEHPLARAVLDGAAARNIALPTASGFKALAGMGVEAQVDGHHYAGGNLRLMRDYLQGEDLALATEKSEALASGGKTPLIFSKGGESPRLLGIIAVADTIKDSSVAAIAQMKAMGLEVVMLTGDNAQTAEAIRRQADISRVVAGVLPAEKEGEITRLREAGRVVAMVGDGVNDAPALAAADVGMAIGAGTDVAMESADVVLMHSDLSDVGTAIALSKAVIRNIKENLFWAFFYNIIGIPIAAGVLYPALGLRLSPMLGALAMSLSSVCVVSNALRLRRFKGPGKKEAIGPMEENKIQEENMKSTLKIEGMMCMHCVANVKKALEAVDGVAAVAVNLEEKTAVVEGASLSPEILKAAVIQAGYQVTSLQ